MFEKKKERVKNYKEMVSTYYAVVTDLYLKFWGEHFHAASWSNNADSIDKALEKTNEMFIKDAKLSRTEKIIDIGCGIGSFCFFVSDRIGCHVTGINFSNYQLKRAKSIQKREKIKNVEFIEMDIMKLGNLKNKFDAAFLIDVGCHLPDKKKAMKNIFNILNDGGRLIIADWLQKEKPNTFEKNILLEPFNKLWSLPYMETLSNYKKLLKNVGFKIITAEDISENVKPTWEKFYNITIDVINNFSLKDMFYFIKNTEILKNPKLAFELIQNQARANISSKICSDAGVLRYGYFVVQK